MGLDITAYKKLKPFNGQYNNETDEVLNIDTNMIIHWEEWFHPHINDHFSERAKDLIDNQYYVYEDSYEFSAGAYSSYNNWREQLAKLAGYPSLDGEGDRHQYSNGAWKASSGPFWELINFSDCSGSIGAKVSKKLLKDFSDFNEKAMQVGEHFYSRYKDWEVAFKFASDNGAVEFH